MNSGETDEIFESGFSRSSLALSEPSYEPVTFAELNGTSYEGSKHRDSTRPQERVQDDDTATRSILDWASTNANTPTANTAQPITQVYDRKNQLTSLVQNAQMNEGALAARNEQLQQAKRTSRRRYGW
ncbi:uncharacterized protein KNAG_0B00200 [Huiozyma naganishii CBS 8797]|uniref:Uncharacterized protein n=1 Tax=Huiozyma naganishii (strain ATCC MYA-139 / BCRC 22969 / CBS 8797 / KCTC 17520 / NBRC 10181 / NCYC 3082 / Yp74L-3) TaxID=1071383 RepID=J7S339_HUIN7|nr:hypothetical protein KNAG_0B00200 [Kazachstania naganishii CBS 8797]CCK68469.1 hypothetical protein KNAG_0B00200 [Kazachstania naganishii CBS 8797]